MKVKTKMQTLEQLAKSWKKFTLASLAAASLWIFSTDYISRNYSSIKDNIQEQSPDNINYSYHGSDGFELKADFGGLRYYYKFDGSCKDESHLFSDGNIVQIMSSHNILSMFDKNCDRLVDYVSSENGSCSSSADSVYELCSQQTYDEANQIFQDALRKLRYEEFSRRYYRQRYDHPELPEGQAKRLLDGFKTKNP